MFYIMCEVAPHGRTIFRHAYCLKLLKIKPLKLFPQPTNINNFLLSISLVPYATLLNPINVLFNSQVNVAHSTLISCKKKCHKQFIFFHATSPGSFPLIPQYPEQQCFRSDLHFHKAASVL